MMNTNALVRFHHDLHSTVCVTRHHTHLHTHTPTTSRFLFQFLSAPFGRFPFVCFSLSRVLIDFLFICETDFSFVVYLRLLTDNLKNLTISFVFSGPVRPRNNKKKTRKLACKKINFSTSS